MAEILSNFNYAQKLSIIPTSSAEVPAPNSSPKPTSGNTNDLPNRQLTQPTPTDSASSANYTRAV